MPIFNGFLLKNIIFFRFENGHVVSWFIFFGFSVGLSYKYKS